MVSPLNSSRVCFYGGSKLSLHGSRVSLHGSRVATMARDKHSFLMSLHDSRVSLYCSMVPDMSIHGSRNEPPWRQCEPLGGSMVSEPPWLDSELPRLQGELL
jgi:hypothetical protein